MTHMLQTSAPAATIDRYSVFYDPTALAVSLKASASYIEHCAEKHNVPLAERRLRESVKRCESIASDMERLKDSNPALIRYRNALGDLDTVQIEAFARIVIDYQARIGSGFVPVSTNHYLADLTAMIFAVAAIDTPVCMGGVGTGFGPRIRYSEVA
ncbi:hypothetical protein SAMN05216358_2729 [Rhizobium sp. AN5]|uniref:hypothetical protein n=1 Tax=Rhizobium sp. AN5 TaxID=1855304 RepID=UPI000BD824F0|nr:hypothetical protein [Rhizobium sp. AN5]SOC92573.1 hypothetical protein SAMN05216358_2729 [Rhizobium sp. AN5]